MENRILDKDDFDKVSGEIYIITNTITNKHYIGQTRSHRLNRGKYRPFGYIGRFNDHISESKSNKLNTCKYLNSSIIKHGKEHFKCEMLVRCSLDELDEYEQRFIKDYNSKHPNGYNLTDGGQKIGHKKGQKCCLDENDIIKPNVFINEDANWFRKLPRSEETKKKISDGIKIALNTKEHLTKMMKHVQTQHYEKKFEIMKGIEFDPDNIDQYISIITNNKNNTQYVQIAFDKKRRISFVGKHESIENIKERAIQFMRELIKRCNTTKLREVPIESSLPLPDGNVLEELG
jgi:predicted nucleic acid-binding Zn finger protein